MDTKTMRAKLDEVKTAYINASPMIKTATGHVIKPMLELMGGMIAAHEVPSTWANGCGEGGCRRCNGRMPGAGSARGS